MRDHDSVERGRQYLERVVETTTLASTTPPANDADMSASHSDRHWPEALAEQAFHGVAGEFVRMTEPPTEADPAALLVQFLVAFGALVGRGPHFRVEGDEHPTNLFALMVGATAMGRKGTSWSRVREGRSASGFQAGSPP